jgi:hypothetical protein
MLETYCDWQASFADFPVPPFGGLMHVCFTAPVQVFPYTQAL